MIPPGERVLVVEDEDEAFDTLSAYLQSAGYVPIRARNGEEALRLARVMQPARHHARHRAAGHGRAGGAAHAEDGRRRHADIPVIIVSMLDNRELGVAFGADDYFVKPVDWPRLLRACARSRAARPHRARLLLIDDDIARARHARSRS